MSTQIIPITTMLDGVLCHCERHETRRMETGGEVFAVTTAILYDERDRTQGCHIVRCVQDGVTIDIDWAREQEWDYC